MDPIDQSQGKVTLSKRLMVLRIIWGALLFGECMFLAVALLVIIPMHVKPDHPQVLLQWVSIGMLVTIVPATFMLRQLLIAKARESGASGVAIVPTLVSANIIFWAGCEGVAFFGIVTAITNVSAMPTLVCTAVAMLGQLASFPRSDALSL